VIKNIFICKIFLFVAISCSIAVANSDSVLKTTSSVGYLEKINPEEIELSRIFSVDLRHDEKFIKAIDSSINFYTSILGTDEQFSYGDEQYTPLQMLHSLIMFRKMVTVERSYDEFLLELREYFDVYVTKSGQEHSKFTGYYTPEIPASFVKTKTFNYPLYLTKTRLKSSKPDFYVQARHDIRALEMEGAGILSLTDGQTLNIQYAGRKLAIDELSKRKAKVVKKIVKKNGKKKAIFVKVRKAPKSKAVFYVTDSGPQGSLSTELVPGYSAAMDMNLTPVGSLIYVKSKETPTNMAEENPNVGFEFKDEKKSGYESFMLVQDIGGAIKGAGRVDIYCGEGKKAESCTYNVSSKGSVYLLIAKKNALTDFISTEVK